MKDMVKLAKIAERCQRNFDFSKPVPNKSVKYILNVATSMPTKQQQEFYNITVIEEERLAREFYTTCTIPDECYYEGDEWRNSQTYAPLVLLYATSDKYERYEPKNDIYMSMGISASAASLAAVNLGYKTGFCKCIDSELAEQFVQKHFYKRVNNPTLALGIGLPLEGYDRSDGVVDGKVVYRAGSDGDKNISIFRRPHRSL